MEVTTDRFTHKPKRVSVYYAKQERKYKMSAVNENELVAMSKEIVSHVRDAVLETIADMEDADPWDEEENGVAWLDNELGMTVAILRTLSPNGEYPDFQDYQTVAEVEHELATCFSKTELSFIAILIRSGGTSHDELVDVSHEEDVDVVRTTLLHLFPNIVLPSSI
jgi:hypothetical protein